MKLVLPNIRIERFAGNLFDQNQTYWRAKLKEIFGLQLLLNSVSSVTLPFTLNEITGWLQANSTRRKDLNSNQSIERIIDYYAV